jgi:hypothetical protein
LDQNDNLDAFVDLASLNNSSSATPSSSDLLDDLLSPMPHPINSKKSKRESPPTETESALKRQRNTLAARKYRQKKLDRIQELEDALREVTSERDDLKLRLARQEAETAAIKEMIRLRSM